MRIGFSKKIMGFRVSSSTNISGRGIIKGLGALLLFPFYISFYISYYVCIWPFVKLFQLVSRARVKKINDPAGAPPAPSSSKSNAGTVSLVRVDISNFDPFLSFDFVVLDTETTGLNPNTDKVIEIALLKISGGKIVDEYCTLVNPQKHISSRVSEINGIYDADVQDAPLYDDVGREIVNFLGNCVIIGHNVKFDLDFMGGLLKNVTLRENLTWEYINTVELAKAAYPGMGNYKLQTLVKELSIDTEGAHRARADAMATWKLFELCRKEISSPDGLLTQAIDIVVEERVASVQLLQRRLKIGYTNAARLIDEMEVRGIVGPFKGAEPREVLITREQRESAAR